MARAIKLIDAPIGLFEVDGILVLKTEYSTRHEDGTITPDCYIIESGEYFWGGVDSVEERNNLEVAPVDMPTLTPPNEPRIINADKLAKRIAGHSNYHGDSILSAIYCAAEGKENNAPIRPIENPPNEWVKVDENLPDFDVPVLVYVKDIFDNKSFISITKYTITYDLTNNWLGYENSSFKITHWMPLPEPPTMET